jgi:hypothetical protein
MSAEVVFCAIDGQQWDALDPGVRYVHGDGRWECVDEVACFDRRSAQRVPDGVAFTEAFGEQPWHGPLPELPPKWSETQLRALGHAFGQMPPMRPGK